MCLSIVPISLVTSVFDTVSKVCPGRAHYWEYAERFSEFYLLFWSRRVLKARTIVPCAPSSTHSSTGLFSAAVFAFGPRDV